MTRRTLLKGAASALRTNTLDGAAKILEEQTRSGYIAGAALYVQHRHKSSLWSFGMAKTADAVFLIASITKPMTATALMMLVDRGQVSLSDPVQRFIPEFRVEGRERVLVRHLLTHASGLPDMLPEDKELRKKHAPLSEFVERTCRTPLLFAPGTEVRYQSMGLLLAAEIVSRIAKQPLAEFLREHLFQPLRMRGTSLGLGDRELAQTMMCQVKEASDWDWNSSYWRNLGAPWGGALSTVRDVGRFLQYFAHPDGKIVKPETAAAMISNQTAGLSKPWGLGWMINDGQFGTGCSAATFGHSGSTGTLCWLDPEKDLTFVLLTTRPAEESSRTVLYPVSDRVSLGEAARYK